MGAKETRLGLKSTLDLLGSFTFIRQARQSLREGTEDPTRRHVEVEATYRFFEPHFGLLERTPFRWTRGKSGAKSV